MPGNNLKDRSAGLVVRYNWIEGGNRQLDLVDGEDDPAIPNDPLYRQTFVYGNVLIEPDGAGNRQIVHYGGDSGNTAIYRKGTLYFYHNTIVSTRTDRTTLFRLSTNDEQCDCRNNLVYVSAAGNTLSLLDDTGVLNFTHNWAKPGWVQSFGGTSGTLINDGSNVGGAAPGFLHEPSQNFRLAPDSVCINAGTNLLPSVLPANAVTSQYETHQAGTPRRQDPGSGSRRLRVFSLARLALRSLWPNLPEFRRRHRRCRPGWRPRPKPPGIRSQPGSQQSVSQRGPLGCHRFGQWRQLWRDPFHSPPSAQRTRLHGSNFHESCPVECRLDLDR